MDYDSIRQQLRKYDYAFWRVMDSVRYVGRRIHLLYHPHNKDSIDVAYEHAKFIIEIIDKAREVSDD